MEEIPKARAQFKGRGKLGLIYYIGCTETNRVKIGFTKSNPLGRLKALRTGCPTEILLFACHPGTQEDERNLHGYFDHLRVRGEWFSQSQDLLQHMLGVCWLEGKACVESGAKPAPWLVVGLQTLEEVTGNALPSDLAGLIR